MEFVLSSEMQWLKSKLFFTNYWVGWVRQCNFEWNYYLQCNSFNSLIAWYLVSLGRHFLGYCRNIFYVCVCVIMLLLLLWTVKRVARGFGRYVRWLTVMVTHSIVFVTFALMFEFCWICGFWVCLLCIFTVLCYAECSIAMRILSVCSSVMLRYCSDKGWVT